MGLSQRARTLGILTTGVLAGYIVRDIILLGEYASQRRELPCARLVRDNACWGGNARKEPVIFSIDTLAESDYGRPGLAHATVAGRRHHGVKDIELWRQVLAPGVRTPIHSHDCEEVFVVEAGRATCVFQNQQTLVRERLVSSKNGTIIIPPCVRHQIINEEPLEDLEYMVVISSPPMDITVYEGWDDMRGVHRGLHIFDQTCPAHGPEVVT